MREPAVPLRAVRAGAYHELLVRGGAAARSLAPCTVRGSFIWRLSGLGLRPLLGGRVRRRRLLLLFTRAEQHAELEGDVPQATRVLGVVLDERLEVRFGERLKLAAALFTCDRLLNSCAHNRVGGIATRTLPAALEDDPVRRRDAAEQHLLDRLEVRSIDVQLLAQAHVLPVEL